MSAVRLRLALICSLVVAAIVSVVGKKANTPWIGQVSIAIFFGSIALYFAWRRAVALERARVFDRETETSDETRSRPDQ